jgi:acyl-CoA oxidase
MQPTHVPPQTPISSNPLNIFAAHDVCGFADGSMATKATVHFNLFAGTVLKLGTDRHVKALQPAIDVLDVTGCFALTELGYGNNAVEMATTATYCARTATWDVHTPTVLAQKYWITNSAVHAQWAVVFARALVGGRDEGVHGFLVRIRNPDMSIVPGVAIHDMGVKVRKGLGGGGGGEGSFLGEE